MDGWNTSFLLGWPIFRDYVSFREGNYYWRDPFLTSMIVVMKKTELSRPRFCACWQQDVVHCCGVGVYECKPDLIHPLFFSWRVQVPKNSDMICKLLPKWRGPNRMHYRILCWGVWTLEGWKRRNSINPIFSWLFPLKLGNLVQQQNGMILVHKLGPKLMILFCSFFSAWQIQFHKDCVKTTSAPEDAVASQYPEWLRSLCSVSFGGAWRRINMEIFGIVLISVHLLLREGVTKFLRLSNMQKALVKDRSSRFIIQGGPLPVVSTAIAPLLRVAVYRGCNPGYPFIRDLNSIYNR